MKLSNNEIHLFFAYPEQITDTDLLHRYKSLLSGDEQKQMSRFYFEHHRHQYLVTRALIRTCLSGYYDVDPKQWVFGKNGFGKPAITHPTQSQVIHFNISHTDGMIMCGLNRDYDIGVDIENSQRSTRIAFKRLSSYFSAQEIEDLAHLPENQQKQRFFDYWTLKESYIKARGAGLSIPLQKFSFLFQGDKLEGFHVQHDLDDEAENWQFWRIGMLEDYRVAVAVNSGNTEFTIKAANAVPLQGSATTTLNFL